ncbi:MAG: GMC family oxidoreductase [Phycisphaerae bacterium]|nr:GMC family oxidoreductase [Phycisphaerae bacterium]
MDGIKTQVLVIGSGAGGAVTAATLAEAGREVLILEEGLDVDTSQMATDTPEAMRLLYRHGGLSPILGNPTSAFVEGRCVGGSTEINSAFWHRTPEKALADWQSRFQIADLSSKTLEPLFEELERELQVTRLGSGDLPPNSVVFKQGAEAMGWEIVEVLRAQASNLTGSAYDAGAKQSMTRTYLPRALKAGAKLMSSCRAVRLQHAGGRVTSATVRRTDTGERFEIGVETAVVCGGAIQTPVLLRSSGIRGQVGNHLQIHPMVKVAAEFEEQMDSHRSSLPVFQVKEFAPEITLGGAVFTPGFLALTLSDNWIQNEAAMEHWRHMALYYATSRGKGRGYVRAFPGTGQAVMWYRFADEDRRLLNTGLARLCELLFRGGARRIYLGAREPAVIADAQECRRFTEKPVPLKALSLSVLHVMGTCRMGEDKSQCATDSFGKVHGFKNLHIGDASLIPDAPGVNPQGTVMALALRNTRRLFGSV